MGAADGFFAIALDKRGAAETIAIDRTSPERTGFFVLQDIFGSKVKYVTDNVYNVSRDKYGEFDIVLCLGLLCRLRNPLLALDRIREVCRGTLYVESFVTDNRFIMRNGKDKPLDEISKDLLEAPISQFYPRDELDGEYSNWWGPNSICLRQMLESTNFTVLSQMFLDIVLYSDVRRMRIMSSNSTEN